MRNVQMIIAYEGTDFHGWQQQPGLRTVQGEIEKVLRRTVRHPVDLTGSGRTDAGVHAAAQVANFLTSCELECEKLKHAVGSRLPGDIALLAVREAPLGFHAISSATSKQYRYRIHNGPDRPVHLQTHRYVYHYRKPLDVDLMAPAAEQFIGEHNFKALASSSSNPKTTYVRTILDCTVTCAGEEIRIDVEGTGFLYNQVRNMAGTLIEIGRGHFAPDCIPHILASQDRQQAGPTAPACGLCLQWVKYPPDEEIPDKLKPPESVQRTTGQRTGSDCEASDSSTTPS